MLGQSLILWVRQNKRGEVKNKEKDEPLFNYSFYRNWTLFNWFVEAFSLKTQRHKRHWVCCCIDLWWSDLYRPCLWAEQLCHVIYVSNILWQLVLCLNHKTDTPKTGNLSQRHFAHLTVHPLLKKKHAFSLVFVQTMKNKRISVIWWKLQRDFKWIGELKLKEKKTIPCRSVKTSKHYICSSFYWC